MFGGTNGDEVRQGVEDIRVAYKVRVEALAAGGYPILDARVTRWHDDFNAFRAHVKDLEEMLIKATDHALASVSCLQDRIVLIEALQVPFFVLPVQLVRTVFPNGTSNILLAYFELALELE